MTVRKRDKDRLRKDAQAAAKKAARDELRQRLPIAHAVRERLQKFELQTIHFDPQERQRGRAVLQKWVPTAHRSIIEVEGRAPRIVIGVHADDVPAMIKWIAPKLAGIIDEKLARRSGSKRGPRGASVILTSRLSSSGPHKDDDDTLLMVVSGERRVWYAASTDVDERVLKRTTQERLGAPTYLPPECDPSGNAPQDGVKWQGPVLLNAGDAIWLVRGMWHCVQAAPGAVAVPLEISKGLFPGEQPRVLRHVAPRKRDDHSGRYVSTRPGWGLAWNACHMWANTLRQSLLAWDHSGLTALP